MNKPPPCPRCGYCGFIEDADMNLAGVCPECKGSGHLKTNLTNQTNMETNEQNRKERLLAETQDVAGRLNKLNAFMADPAFPKLPRAAKDLLYSQSRTMNRLVQILGKRLELAGSVFEHPLDGESPKVEETTPSGLLARPTPVTDDLRDMIKDCWTAMRSAYHRMDTIRETNPEIALALDMAQLASHLPHLRNPYLDSDIDEAVMKFRRQKPIEDDHDPKWEDSRTCAEDPEY